MAKRSQLSRTLQLFDAPDHVLSAGNRPTTITAPQALMFLNSPFVRARAQDFARRLHPDFEHSATDAVRRGYLIATGRPPRTDEERTAGRAGEAAWPARPVVPARAFCRMCGCES